MYLDNWIKTKIGLNEADALTRDKLAEYQLFKLQETLIYAKKNSRFYEKHLNGIDPVRNIRTLSDIPKLPFTTPEMLIREGLRMVCVSQGDISRIVTLYTSGTTGDPKRVFYTEEDQELTIDYFHHGMRVMTRPSDTFMILLHASTPGSVGDLLRIGLERDGIKVIPYGQPADDGSNDEEIINIMKEEGVSSLVGMPTDVARLASTSGGELPQIRTALLTAEYVSPEDARLVESTWSCEVFEHYGMTETGLGGAMACTAHHGYHPREADLFYEIIDPETGDVLFEGERGELVFTTLTRMGMPLIRYRTGDMTRFIPGKCPCGSILKRLDRIEDRDIAVGKLIP